MNVSSSVTTMKKHYWIIIGIVLALMAASVVWTERLRSQSQDVTIVELVLPKPDLKFDDIVLLDVLNEYFINHTLGEVGYYQGFQVSKSGNQIVAGNFSYNQVAAVRKKLEQLPRKDSEIQWDPLFEGRVPFHQTIAFNVGQTLIIKGEYEKTLIEAAVKLSPEAEPLSAHFYDGHTLLFGRVVNDELRILFITIITPPKSMFEKFWNSSRGCDEDDPIVASDRGNNGCVNQRSVLNYFR